MFVVFVVWFTFQQRIHPNGAVLLLPVVILIMAAIGLALECFSPH